MAICSLVLGIVSIVLSWLCLSFLAIPGVICGHMALARIKQSGGATEGRSLAVGGLVTGYIGIALMIFWMPLMAAIAIPNFVKARQISMQNACINNLRQIEAAKNLWAMEHHKEATDTPTQGDLLPYFGNHQFPKCPAGGIYTIGQDSVPPTCSITNHVLPMN